LYLFFNAGYFLKPIEMDEPRWTVCQRVVPVAGMSMSGLSINSIGSSYSPSSSQNAGTSAQTAFHNLGQALASGNLPAARTAFAALQKTFQIQTSLAQSSSWTGVAGRINSVAQSLDSGNLAAAQAAYANLQQDLQIQAQGNKHSSVTRGHSSSRA
jgi:hypothetical protein